MHKGRRCCKDWKNQRMGRGQQKSKWIKERTEKRVELIFFKPSNDELSYTC